MGLLHPVVLYDRPASRCGPLHRLALIHDTTGDALEPRHPLGGAGAELICAAEQHLGQHTTWATHSLSEGSLAFTPDGQVGLSDVGLG